MADGVFTVTLRRNRVPVVIVDLQNRVKETVDGVAADIQTRAASLAPVDTGSLRASIYRTNGDESDYRDKAGAARGVNDNAVIVAEVNPDLVISPSGGEDASYMVVVGSAVEHAAVQELGSARLRAQPYMIPAVLGLREDFVAQMEHVADGL